MNVGECENAAENRRWVRGFMEHHGLGEAIIHDGTMSKSVVILKRSILASDPDGW